MRERVNDGKGPLGFIIERNFTESLRIRYALLITNFECLVSMVTFIFIVKVSTSL